MKEVTIEVVESKEKGSCEGCMFYYGTMCTPCEVPTERLRLPLCGDGYIYKIKEK